MWGGIGSSQKMPKLAKRSEFEPIRLTDNSILKIHFTTGKIKTKYVELSVQILYLLGFKRSHISEMFLHSVHRAYYKKTKFFGQVDSIFRV